MILSITIVGSFSVIYALIGKGLNHPFLIRCKKNWNIFLLRSMIGYLRKNEKETLNYAYGFFLMIGLFAYFLSLLVSKHPSADIFGYPWELEATFFVLPLLFGFKQNSEVKEHSLVIINKIQRLIGIIIIPCCILLVFIKQAYPTITELTSSNLVEMCLIIIIALIILTVAMFTVYVLVPHVSSKLIAKTLKFVFHRILWYDRKDPTSGLFRYFACLIGAFSLLRFIVGWFLPVY